MTPSFASKWLLPRLPQFEASHPNIDLRIEVNETLANLETNPADIFIHYGHSQEQSSLFNEQLIDTQLLAVCSLGYARKHCVQYAVDDSQSTFHIETPSACTISHLIQDQHKYWENWFNQTQLKSKEKMLVFNQTSLAIDAAINGQGITLVRDILVQQHLKQGELITLCSLPSSAEEGYYLSYSTQKIQQQSNIAIVKSWLESHLSIKNQNISHI